MQTGTMNHLCLKQIRDPLAGAGCGGMDAPTRLNEGRRNDAAHLEKYKVLANLKNLVYNTRYIRCSATMGMSCHLWIFYFFFLMLVFRKRKKKNAVGCLQVLEGG